MTETQTKEVATPAGPKHEGKTMMATTSYEHAMEPRNFKELQELCTLLAASDIVPKDLQHKPANLLIVLMFGREIGLTTAQALQNVMVVNGRPSLWGDAVMGLVLSSSIYEDSKDEFDEKTMTATFHAKRKGKDWLVRSFSEADAKKANLWSKAGPWQQYPKRMLFHRARSWALRDSFADVLKGIRYFEEERDAITVTVQDDGTYAMPKAKTATAPASQPKAEPQPTATAPKTEPTKEPATGTTPQNVFSGVVTRSAKTTIGDRELTVFTVKTGPKDRQETKIYTDVEETVAAIEAYKDGETKLTFTCDYILERNWVVSLEKAAV